MTRRGLFGLVAAAFLGRKSLIALPPAPAFSLPPGYEDMLRYELAVRYFNPAALALAQEIDRQAFRFHRDEILVCEVVRP